MNAMRYLLPLLSLAFLILLLVTIVRWAFVDARQRGKSAWLVALLVVALPFLGWLLWLAIRPPLTKEPSDRFFTYDESWKSYSTLLLCFALAWYHVGIIGIAQLVMYPLKAYVGAEKFITYDASYAERIALPVVLIFVFLLFVSLLLVWFRPRGVPT